MEPTWFHLGLKVNMGLQYNDDEKYTLNIKIRLSLQRALLCEVDSNLRMVSADWDDKNKKIVLFFYFDGEISDDNKASASCVGGEVSGDFDEDVQIVEKCIRLDLPQQLPLSHMCTAYRRRE